MPSSQTRLRRLKGGRPHVVYVRLGDEEFAELTKRAGERGLSRPRYLVEMATVGERLNITERRSLIAAFMAAKRSMAESGAALLGLVVGMDGRPESDRCWEILARHYKVTDQLTSTVEDLERVIE